ncbi:MAG TPA: CaiB/BaiF CoA-transferase family protein [Pseudonocardia sp.]|jgi:alpha-methylacyl-CoA racemase|nr:CaiB/BaiF CoA-transferase family protein [Pseudonocardia sp.]
MVEHGNGPLAGVRVVEMAGLGPAPFAAMVLADMGADVVTVGRPGPTLQGPPSMNRGKRSLVLDVRTPEGRQTLLELAAKADIFIEAYRPGVVERLGIGPEDCWALNPRLVYGRMTGWGQQGPRAQEAGHDIGYVGLTGALHAIGPRNGPPVPPLALVGDLGGGGMFLVTGVLAALHEAKTSGLGQVVDAAIVDGAATLMTPFYGMMELGAWVDERESNMLDGGQPWYRVYRTADDRWLAVGAIEPQFWSELLVKLEIPESETSREDPSTWPELGERLATVIGSRTRDEWEKVFAGSDACAAPVRSMSEAPHDPHLAARETFVEVGGCLQPAPAPRFSRTPSPVPQPASAPGSDTDDVLRDWGLGTPA